MIHSSQLVAACAHVVDGVSWPTSLKLFDIMYVFTGTACASNLLSTGVDPSATRTTTI